MAASLRVNSSCKEYLDKGLTDQQLNSETLIDYLRESCIHKTMLEVKVSSPISGKKESTFPVLNRGPYSRYFPLAPGSLAWSFILFVVFWLLARSSKVTLKQL